MNKNNVFVVHGRNHKVKDAMFAFLRSLNLKPLEWEQARALTNKSSPTTLEIVKIGIENSQCIVILLTGDDITQLSSQYGNERPLVQPRPNVIFEAGWALAISGQERTLFVKFGNLRGFSDIDGINYITLNNSSKSRKAIVGRLKTAGCNVDDSGSDYLNPDSGGNFELDLYDNGTNHDFYPELKERGKFTEFIADSSLSYKLSNIELNRELYSDLKDITRIDLKYHYLGVDCASYWIALSQHPEYGHQNLRNTIYSNSREILNEITQSSNSTKGPIDLISLGPGDGDIDSRFLNQIERSGLKITYYYCIDISFELLQHAVSKVIRSQFRKGDFRIKAIHGDFTNLERLKSIYAYDPSINLFSLFGYTFGNYNESALLSAISNGMDSGDFLLLDARLHNLEDWDGQSPLSEDDKMSILQIYSHKVNERFAFGPVEVSTNSNFENVHFSYEISSRLTSVPKAINVITSCSDLNTKMRTTGEKVKKDKMDLASTTLYGFDELQAWFKLREFKILYAKKNKDSGLFLLRKN